MLCFVPKGRGEERKELSLFAHARFSSTYVTLRRFTEKPFYSKKANKEKKE